MAKLRPSITRFVLMSCPIALLLIETAGFRLP